MSLQDCQEQLRDQYKQDFSQSENVSKLMRDSRWDQKLTCFNEMGWLTNVTKFLDTVKRTRELPAVSVEKIKDGNQEVEDNKSENIHNSASEYTTSKWESSDTFSEISQYAITWVKFIVWWMLLVIAWIILWKMWRKTMAFMYDMLNAPRTKYLKVLLPRWEWKLDREKAKEIAKDMKEKISRMSQIYNNIHKLWELSMMDNIMRWLFKKPKLTLFYHYEKWTLNFIIWTYPEYQRILESAISAQFAESSIETIKKPKVFSKKYSYIMPMWTKKEPAYTIKMFKNMPDDPINNIIDAMAKVPTYDTFTIMIPIKPAWESFNKRAKLLSTALFKDDPDLLKGTQRWKVLLMPWKLIWFFINWPSDELISRSTDKEKKWDAIVRMVKAEEESINAMWEEAAQSAFYSGITLITSTDTKERIKDNMHLMISAFNIYNDQYANELDNPEKIADIFWVFLQPLRKIAVNFRLTKFFTKRNTFSINELSSIFHFPDATYNRSNTIEWMQYKVLPAPRNVPRFTDFNWYIMSWIVAEKYKDGKMSDILQEYKKHRAVWEKTVMDERLDPVEKYTKKQLMDKEIVEKDGKQMVKIKYEKKVTWYKLSREWILLWVNIYKNKYEPIYMKRDDRTRHHYCIGKSGTWKSVYLQTLARQDMRNGDWICVIDPHGDLVEDLLEYVPKERAKDVIFFDAGDEERPLGLNLYEIDSIDEADRTVNDATEIFIKMFGPEIFGPRIQEYFKFGSLTILEDFEDRPTILDVPRLFTDDTYREFKTKNIQNPVVKNFREKTFNAMGDREKKEIIPYFTSKFVSFNTNRLIRNIIGQTKSWFKLDDVMNNQKILLISLSKGKIGEMNAQLLGMILVSKIYNAAMWRARMPQNERKDFYLYVDEFQNFVSGTFADILSEARKYRLCLIMAHQYIAQLESGKQEWWKADVKAAVFGNTWTMQSFKVGAPDGEFLEKEYAPILSQQDIIGIANYKAYMKLNINNTTSRPFSMNSIYTSDYRNKKIAPILKEYSAKKFGRKREFIDAEIAAKLWLWVDELDNVAEWHTTLDAAQEKSKKEGKIPQIAKPQATTTQPQPKPPQANIKPTA